jgi:hypothetical protein
METTKCMAYGLIMLHHFTGYSDWNVELACSVDASMFIEDDPLFLCHIYCRHDSMQSKEPWEAIYEYAGSVQ